MKETAGKLGFSRELRHLAASKICESLLRKLNLEFSEESHQNLLETNKLLAQHSVIIYINHTSMLVDVELPISMVLTHLTNAKRIVGPVAMKHYDPSRDKKNAMFLRLLKPLGIEVFPIVQPKSIDEDAIGYSGEEKQSLSADLKVAITNAVNFPGKVLGITPEGTRSKNGKLLPARTGIGYLESYDPNNSLRYLPIAIILERFSNCPKFEVGKPFGLGELNIEKGTLPEDPKKRARTLTDMHMLRLASMLPPEMRGAYSNIPEK